jgi:nitrate reductase gamma subunit
MTPEILLQWERGPGLQLAVGTFAIGMVFRMGHLALLGRRKDLATPRGSEWGPGIRMIWRRSYPLPRLSSRGKLTVAAGYVFHLGLLVTLFFLSQHIDLFRSVLGFGWPALPGGVVDISAILGIASLIVLLVHRFIDPVKRMLSGFEDYLTWAFTFLPLLTGFMLDHSAALDYTRRMVLHLSSVELLLVLIPFTKLAHMFSTFGARWYNGAIAGFKGVEP